MARINVSFVVLFLAGILGFTSLTLQVDTAVTTSKPRFIVDTDIGPWPDDVGALSMLHTWADHGLLDIVAIMANNRYDGIVAVIDALNTYLNRTDIPLGITKDPSAMSTTGTLGWPEYVLAHYPHPKYANNSQAEDAVTLYRRLLSKSQDGSLTILSIGYLTNLANLLATSADQYSNATGRELVRSKVVHTYFMAGAYPRGEELNIKDQTEPARATLPDWPTPATFVGYEAGVSITCGGNLLNTTTNSSILTDSPVSKAFELAFKAFGHIDGCFDETATLVAVKGTLPLYDTVPGTVAIYPNGTDVWNPKPTSNHAYVKQKATVRNATIIDEINPLLVR